MTAAWPRDLRRLWRPLGESDLLVSPVVLGAWAMGGWYWGGADDDESIRTIHRAFDRGINCIDTAPIYGFGRSESVVGRAIQGRRADVVIATKCGLRWDTDVGEPFFETTDERGRSRQVVRNLRCASILAECEESLLRLGVDEIDLYQCHWPDPATPLDEAAEAFDRLRDQGKVRAFGLSNHDPAAMARWRAWLPLHSAQNPYGLLDRRAALELLPWCRAQGVSVLAYDVLGQGLLTGRVTAERRFPPGDLRPTKSRFAPERVKALGAALSTCAQEVPAAGASHAQRAIRWVLGSPGVTAAIVGARRPEQIDENAAAATGELSPGERARLEALLAEFARK